MTPLPRFVAAGEALTDLLATSGATRHGHDAAARRAA
jgi:hypothetical protein